MRNCNGLEAATGASAQELTFVCDAKGLAQLYQYAVGGDFFSMQRADDFELSLREVRVCDSKCRCVCVSSASACGGPPPRVHGPSLR